MILTPNVVASLSDLFRHCPVAGHDSYRQSAHFLTDLQQSNLKRRLQFLFRGESIIARIPTPKLDLSGSNIALEKVTIGKAKAHGTLVVTSHRLVILEGEKRTSFYRSIPYEDLIGIEEPVQYRSRFVLKFKAKKAIYSLQFVVTSDSETKTRFNNAIQGLYAALAQPK